MKILAMALGAMAFAQAAAASPCGDRIAKLQAQYDAAKPAAAADVPVGAAGVAAETTQARLHHQPSAATPGDALNSPNSEAALRNARFRNDMFNAQAAEDSGDVAGCEAALAAAQKELPR
jgi:hypothetical protein